MRRSSRLEERLDNSPRIVCSGCIYDSHGRSVTSNMVSWIFFMQAQVLRTCGGPSIVPFQLDINRSSPSERPYEQASKYPFSATCCEESKDGSFTSSESLFSLLKLFKQTKVPRNFSCHCEHGVPFPLPCQYQFRRAGPV